MTISATTQGLRMGVATSSSRPTVPFDGQVISETDTDSLSVYKGSAWAPVSGLTFISSASPSAQSSISVNNCFSSTYQNYRVLINYTASVGANAMTTMRLRASGTDSTTGYKSILMGWGAGAATSAADVSGTDDWYVTYLDPTGNSNIVAIDVFNPFGAAPTTTISTAGYASSIPNYYAQVIYSANTASTSYDGFTILTSGTSFTGNIRVYGYSNS
jgi:hypothetical protein